MNGLLPIKLVWCGHLNAVCLSKVCLVRLKVFVSKNHHAENRVQQRDVASGDEGLCVGT